MTSKKHQSVLVTGADGFIGSHLVELLLAEGYKVRALAQYNSFNYWGWLEDVKHTPELDIVMGDIRDAFFTEELTKNIDVVFHLAALIAIPYSYVAPQSYVETNINGTLNICNASLKNKVKRVLVTSTSEVYGTAQYVPIDEKHPLQPQSPYSASKIGADAMSMGFYNSFDLPLTIVRPFNTYGPRQSARAVIPTIIAQIANGAKKIQLGDTTPTRDFTYVEDTCHGFIELANCNESLGKTVNIGTNTEISIADTFALIKKIMESAAELENDPQRLRPEKSEVFRLKCDNTLIKDLTPFKLRYSIEEGMKKTVEWFTNKQNLAKYKSNHYNR